MMTFPRVRFLVWILALVMAPSVLWPAAKTADQDSWKTIEQKLLLDLKQRVGTLENSLANSATEGSEKNADFVRALESLSKEVDRLEANDTSRRSDVNEALNSLADLREQVVMLQAKVSSAQEARTEPDVGTDKTPVDQNHPSVEEIARKAAKSDEAVRLTTRLIHKGVIAGPRRASKTSEVRLACRVGRVDVPIARREILVTFTDGEGGQVIEIARCHTDDSGVASFTWTLPGGGKTRKPMLHFEFAGDATFLPVQSKARVGISG